MSQEEPFLEDMEYQNTQKEIEELRRREEELKTKINALEKRQKSASVNTLVEGKLDEEVIVSDHDDDENEDLGKRRRPSLSRSSKSTETPPKALEVMKSQAGTFRSRSSRSLDTSPTKEIGRKKESLYSSPTVVSTKQSSARVMPEVTSRSKSHRIEVSTSSVDSPTKEESQNGAPKSKMIRSYSNTSSGRSPRNNGTHLSKSSMNARALNRRSFPGIEDNDRDNEFQNETKYYRVNSVSRKNVPENKLKDREMSGSEDSLGDGTSRASMQINEDSYEIIEIDNDKIQQSPREEKVGLSTKEKIEKEIAEQKEREEELRVIQMLSESYGEEDIHNARGYSSTNESTSDDDSEVEKESEVEVDEKSTLSTWEKIALEIEEERRREEEVRIKKIEEKDRDSAVDGSESEEEVSNDVFQRITQETEEQKRREREIRKYSNKEEDVTSEEETNGKVKEIGLSVQDRIELEIKEIEKRESELKKMHTSGEQEYLLEEDEEPKIHLKDSGAKSKIQQEIDDFKRKESEFRKLHGVDEEMYSDDEDSDSSRSNSIALIDGTLTEQKGNEWEFKRQHKNDIQKENEEIDESERIWDDDEIPEDESMLIERNKRKTNVKSEFIVAPGITKKFIHLFDRGVEKYPTKINGKISERSNIIRQGHENNKTNEDESETMQNDSLEKQEDGNEEEADKLDTMSDNSEMLMKEQAAAKQCSINAPSPGKKLVLKRKKSKDRKHEQYENTRNEKELNDTLKGSQIISSKGAKPGKKAHPLAMHWEKLQYEKQCEATKYNKVVKKGLQETEKRSNRGNEEKQEREKIRAQNEKKDLQSRCKSLAESWEKKTDSDISSNNNNSGKENQSLSIVSSQSKREIGKTTPNKKFPASRKEKGISRKTQEAPKSTKANIQMWEQRIALSKKTK